MLKLSKEREKNILKLLSKQKRYENGSSRAVFLFENFVIKVAFDLGGFLQNEREIELYKDYGSEYLAKIFAYGDYILIMERVELLDYEMVGDVVEYEGDYNEYLYFFDREVPGINDKITDTVYFLHDINLETTDNYQLGLTNDDRVVAYDYGYFESGQTLGKNNLNRYEIVNNLLLELYLEY